MSDLKNFLIDDSGVMTMDWVALSAGILLVGIVVVYSLFNNGVSSLVSSVNTFDAGFGNAGALLIAENLND